jgi:tripartite-type tricarboxylate transporter receptor subunit TctC
MRVAILVSLFLLHAWTVHAQAYPVRPVRVLVPIAPGGGMDSLTRVLALNLADALGQSFVVDNRPGAGNQFALRAPNKMTLVR